MEQHDDGHRPAPRPDPRDDPRDDELEDVLGPSVGHHGDASDPLVAARIALDEVRELPLDERAVVFEQVHTTVVAELRQLELG